jgi:hypothetical protein
MKGAADARICQLSLPKLITVSATSLSSDAGRANCRSMVKTRTPGFFGLDTEADDLRQRHFLQIGLTTIARD